MGHYVADENKLEAQATLDTWVQLHKQLEKIYVCNKACHVKKCCCYSR